MGRGENRVEEWLASNGFGHLASAFREHGIEFDQLAELTDDELREIGLNVGDRRRFRRAISAMAGQSGGNELAMATPTERRPLTVMFVDLVGSAELGETLEPEDLLEVIRRYRELCGAAVQRFGGSVARHVGDGTLAYFSYPVATENDPERAVRAALAIVRNIEQLTTPAPRPLQVRIGIATGRVVISDLREAGTADLRSVVGSAPNLAARLQSIARPGGIIIARETHERVRRFYACEDLGPQKFRGFSEPRPAWRVLHELPRHAWRQAESPHQSVPLLAREAEIAALAALWRRASDGNGRAALVTGEAGIGKSRLIEKFIEQHCGPECRVVQLAASTFDSDSPLRPFAAWLLAEAGPVPPGTTGEARPESVDIGRLLGLGEEEIARLSPAQLRERTLTALERRVLGLDAAGPVCLVIEDLHWLDPTSLELLGRLVPQLANRRLMLLLTARDGVEAEWLDHAALTTLRLPRLRAQDVAAIVRALFEQSSVPERFVEALVQKSDGVPLFVVELLRGLIGPEAQIQRNDGLEDAEGEIPATLHESLMARLDRAGLAREVAQVAAVIGRSVRPEALAVVAERSEAELEAPLAALVDAGVLLREAGGGGYTFSHTLVRDAAYDSLVRDSRQALHLRVARMLESRDAGLVARQPELLAHHLAEAGLGEEAAPHWAEAARRSLSRSALTEATRLLRRGLAALDKLPVGPSQMDHKARLMALLGPALIALKGPGSADALELYAQAYALSEELPDSEALFPILWGWWRMSRDFAAKLDRARALLRRARPRGDDGTLLQAHHCCWASYYCSGELDRSREHALAGLSIYAHGNYRDHARLYGNHDAKVCAHGELAEIDWLQGRPVQALAQERQALAWARELNHLGTMAHAMDYALMHRAMRRDLSEVFTRAGELASFAAEHSLADHHAKSLIFRGWSLAMSEDPAAGLRLLEEGVARQRDIGTDEDFPIYLSLLAEVLLRQGKAERAIGELQAAREEFTRMALQATIPELLRVLGEATLAADPLALSAAFDLFAEADTRAAAQGAAMLRLRTAVSAARLHARIGQAETGAAELARALARVAEPDGVDLREAHLLLARLRRVGVAAAE